MILHSLFCPSANYYRIIARNPEVQINLNARFDKRQKEVHRMVIADVRGAVELTVPIAKPYGKTWGETRISQHGHWNRTMWTALESAYGRTPYFEFYADDFRPLLADRNDFGTVTELNAQFDSVIRHCLQLPIEGIEPANMEVNSQPPYWQIRQDKLGFIPNLSILDLIFNLGPEALIYLLQWH